MWQTSAQDYHDLIGNPEWDSLFLRRQGLKPNVLEMIGECDDAVVLDAGTGTGWLFNYIKPAEAYACDIIEPDSLPDGVRFSKQDVHKLNYPGGKFDIVVASLLLIYCEDLDVVCREFHRVSKPNGGRFIVSLMHPYFYRTGHVTQSNDFVVTEDLSRPFQIPFKIAEQVGPLTYFYRPLPDYINTLIGAGWAIKEMRDWFIDSDSYGKFVAEGMKTKVKRSTRIPLFTFIECEKT